MNGILLVDKPQGITSHDVVDRLRKATHVRRIGHTGTLDPRATGLLILCIGQATRLSQYLSGLDKVYEGAMHLGLATASHDLDGAVLEEREVPENLTRGAIQEAAHAFVGNIQQIPPMVSAIKIGGKRLYKIAREGVEMERPPRPVTVHCFDITYWNPPEAGLRIHCTSGAYVRTLCHDVGQRLGCGAALAQLRRTQIDRYSIEDAACLDQLKTVEAVQERLIAMEHALHLPEVRVDKAHETIIRSGGAVPMRSLQSSCNLSSEWIQIKSSSGKLIAMGRVLSSASGGSLQPKCVFSG